MTRSLSSATCAMALIVTVTFTTTASQGVEGLQDNPGKPNVILIYTDDQGTMDVGCYGAKDLITPHLDELAFRGIRWTQFYSAAPVCSPSRAAVLTGRYPQRAGLAGNAGSQPGSEGMPASQVTMAEMFKAAGYATGHVGKWHLGYVPETMPNAQGFDDSFGHMGGCIDNYSHFFYWNGPNRHDLWRNGKEIWEDGKFFPQLMVREAERFVDAHQEQPFFLYWAINVPHYPLQGTENWRKRYQHLKPPRRMYAAFVSTMDEMIGQLLGHLKERGLRENTIVIFQSDHGHSTEQRTFGGGGSAGKYRGAKFSLFEGGIRVPAIISWPGHLPEHQVRHQLATSVDWLPTLAKLTAVPLPKRRLDGNSLLPAIKSPEGESPHDVFHWQSGRGLGGKPQWAVRAGSWKLIGNPKDTSNKAPLTAADKFFLVNLDQDPTEMANVARQHPEITQRLKELHEKWLEEVTQQ
ncbi:MAG: sulfatase-like hydrolase/transferase [Pirellulaceae bacterium]